MSLHRAFLAASLLFAALSPAMAADAPASASTGSKGSGGSKLPEYKEADATLFVPRDGIGNVLQKLNEGKDVKVAYLGGSITAANGWRPQTLEWLKKTYPNAKIEQIHAAIGGTGSNLGVFRMDHDVLPFKPDLLFVEFAVNDGGADPARIWRGMEGIVRKMWKQDPHTDIVFIYTFAVGAENSLRNNKCTRSMSAMEQVAERYGIPSINVALPVVIIEKQGSLVFKAPEPPTDGKIHFSTDGVHPLTAGHQIYTDSIAQAFEMMAPNAKPFDHKPRLNGYFVPDNWENAVMVPITKSMLTGDWKQLPTDAGLGKSFGNRMGTLWEADGPNNKLSFKFKGSAASLYDLVGPNGGQVIVTVDGKSSSKPIPRFDQHCTYHRIATLGLANDLDPNKVHEVTVEIHPDQPDRSSVASRLKDPQTELKSPKYQGRKLVTSHLLLIGELVP